MVFNFLQVKRPNQQYQSTEGTHRVHASAFKHRILKFLLLVLFIQTYLKTECSVRFCRATLSIYVPQNSDMKPRTSQL